MHIQALDNNFKSYQLDRSLLVHVCQYSLLCNFNSIAKHQWLACNDKNVKKQTHRKYLKEHAQFLISHQSLSKSKPFPLLSLMQILYKQVPMGAMSTTPKPLVPSHSSQAYTAHLPSLNIWHCIQIQSFPTAFEVLH